MKLKVTSLAKYKKITKETTNDCAMIVLIDSYYNALTTEVVNLKNTCEEVQF